MIEFKDPVAERIKTIILDETALQIENRNYPSVKVWRELRGRGSRIWLHGCDKLAEELWSGDMQAICSDAHQLNAAVQRGEYNRLIDLAGSVLKGLPTPERLAEIAFIVNARHAVKLSKKFAAKVSVEVPPLPGGAAEIQQYAQRLFQVCPEYILVSLPFSCNGLEAGAELSRSGIPVTISNQYTLEQLIHSVRSASPAYLAVNMQDVPLKGEEILHYLAEQDSPLTNTRLIAEGIRTAEEVARFSGFPILKISSTVAREYSIRPDLHHQSPPDNSLPDVDSGNPAGGETPGNAALSRRYLKAQQLEYRLLRQLISNTTDSN